MPGYPNALFPASFDTLNQIGPTGGSEQTPNTQGETHNGIHAQLAAVVTAIETIIGVNGSTDPSSIEYRLAAAGSGGVIALVDAATIATDASLGSVGDVTIVANRTMGAPTNPRNGQAFTWRITQGATGRTITWNAVFNFGAAGAPSLSTVIGDTDLITGVYNSATSTWNMAPASVTAKGLGQIRRQITDASVLTQADGGSTLYYAGAGAYTLPTAASLLTHGSNFGFIVSIINGNGANMTITASGGDLLYGPNHNSVVGVAAITLRPLESVILYITTGQWNIIGGAGENVQARALVGNVVTLTDQATIATDASLGNTGDVTITASRAMGVPTNPRDGENFTWRITQGGSGSFLITWDVTAFDFGAAGAPTLSTAAGSVDLVGGKYNAAKAKWQMVPASLGYT